MRRLVLTPCMRNAAFYQRPRAPVAQRVYKGTGANVLLPPLRGRRHHRGGRQRCDRHSHSMRGRGGCVSGPGETLSRREDVGGFQHAQVSPEQTATKSGTPKQAKHATAGLSRFSHRRDTLDHRPVAHRGPLAAPGTSVQGGGWPNAGRPAPPVAPQWDALQHLLKVHAVMKANYEALGKCTQVLNGFSMACAKALQQLGVLEESGGEQHSGTEGLISVRLCEPSATASNGNKTSLPLFALPLDTPLYRTTIRFPSVTVEQVIAAAVAGDCRRNSSSEATMPVETENAIPTATGSQEPQHSTSPCNVTGRESYWGADVSIHMDVWKSIVEGLEQVDSLLRQNASVSDLVRLVGTLAYFKWVKDEEHVGWSVEESVVDKFRGVMAVNGITASGPSSGLLGAEIHEALAATAKALLDRIPLVDSIHDTPKPTGEPAKPCVHVIDVTLNLFLRLCLSQWEVLSHADRTDIVLVCTYPWFAEDQSIGAGICLTQFFLRCLAFSDSSVTYQHTFHYVRRLQRLCWPCIHDADSVPVKKVLFEESQGTVSYSYPQLEVTVDEKGGKVDAPEGVQGGEHATSTITPEFHRPLSFRDVSCISYGSPTKQRAAYELLLIWLSCVNTPNLHRVSPHGRYVSATGIAIIDVDLFTTQRSSAQCIGNEWVLLRPVGVDDTVGSAVKMLRQRCRVPHALTRLFFCNYLNVLPHIWGGIGVRRRAVIWAAWLRAVAQPLVSALAGTPKGQQGDNEGVPTFDPVAGYGDQTLDCLKPLISILMGCELFSRLVVRAVLKSLGEMTSEIGDDGNTVVLSEWCERLTELVYSSALALHCMAKKEECCIYEGDAGRGLTNGAPDEKALVEPSKDVAREGAQEGIMALRLHFKAAISALLRRLGAGDVRIVEQLICNLYELRVSVERRTELLGDIQKQLRRVCDSQSREALYAWVACGSRASAEGMLALKEELLQEWRRVVLEADAGLPVTLPTLVECCRGLVGLVRRRGHSAFDKEQDQRQQTESAASRRGVSPAEVFTKDELSVVVTILSRAMLDRTCTVSTVGLTKLSSEIRIIMASRTNETSDRSANGSNRKNQGPQVANVPTAASFAAVQRTIELETILANEVQLRLGELPWITILEAVQLQLVPYNVVKALLTHTQGTSGGEKGCFGWQELQRDFQRKRHYRLVCSAVLFRWCGYAAPHGEGWGTESAIKCLTEEESEGKAKGDSPAPSQLMLVTQQLLKVLTRAELSWVDEAGEISNCTAIVAGTEGDSRQPIPRKEEEVKMEQLDLLLRTHTLAAHILVTTSTRRRYMLNESYVTLLSLMKKITSALSHSLSNVSDLLLLWLVSSAAAVGVHFQQKFLVKWPSTADVTRADELRFSSNEEKTVCIVRSIEPHLQSELLRPTVRLRFVINVLVALRSLELLGARVDVEGIHMDQLLTRASNDRRLLSRHVNLLLIGCSALHSTQLSFLTTASYLREVRHNLSFAEMERAFVAIALSADAFAKQHETFTEQSQQQQQSSVFSTAGTANTTIPSLRVPPVQLRHAWSALGRRLLECACESPTDVFVRALQCAAAVGCVDSTLYQQLLSYVVEFRWRGLGLLDWVVILKTARQSFENQRALEAYLQEPVQQFMLTMVEAEDDVACDGNKRSALKYHKGERLLEELCLFAEALPELFIGDAALWKLLWQALGSQWSACFNAAGSIDEQEKISMWLQDISASYSWAVQTAGFPELSESPSL